jgi:hypothetical protein
MKKAMLTPHFSFDELTVTSRRELEEKNRFEAAGFIDEIRETCAVLLEPIRAWAKRAVIITSGFRGPALNAAVGGADDSGHLYGVAADLVVSGVENEDVFDWIRGSELPYDQVILEPGWIHISRAKKGGRPRREALIFDGKSYRKA